MSQSRTLTTQSELLAGYKWGVDCEMYASWAHGKTFDLAKYKRALGRIKDHSGDCRFVVVPDVIPDAEKTIDQYRKLEPEFRKFGLPVAFVAQNGLTRIPDDLNYDCLFLGATNDYRFSQDARNIIAQAKDAGKWVHVGRVNTPKGIEFAFHLGADSCDGTKPAKEPAKIITICAQIAALNNQMSF
jgi:hypothetical protein